MAYRTIPDLDLSRRRVFVRVDFNVPLDESGQEISSDTRIRAALPTIHLALEKGAAVILASHLGRPKGRRNSKMSLAPVALRLAELLGRPVKMARDCVGLEAARITDAVNPGDVVLLENLRFHVQEEANDPDFAKQLASLCDCYVNDAFGAAHRAHASTAGVVAHVEEAAAGLLMEKELRHLSMAVNNPKRPYVAIVGGAKISGKIDVLENFVGLADRILIGGAMTYTFLKAQGLAVGDSLVEDDKLGVALRVMRRADDKLLLPVDHRIAQKIDPHAEIKVVEGGPSRPIPEGWRGLDIGPRTVEAYSAEIGKAQTIVWNGPMGVFEVEPFRQGTVEIAKAVARSQGTSIVGGGDSEKAIRVAGVGEQITHISTGGGASLEFLAGRKLPGVEALGGIE